PTTLRTIIDYFENLSKDYEIIVVDDGSQDNTAEIAQRFNPRVKVIKLSKNSGKGAAVREGISRAQGDFILFSDADLSTPITEFHKLQESLENGSHIAIGSRAIDSSLIKVHQPFYREFMGKTFNKIVRALVLRGIHDTQCGFKMFKNSVAKQIFSLAKIDGFGFDVEILYLAHKMNFKIAEIPVEWRNDTKSKISPIYDSLKMFFEILKIRSLHK
ncbi:MAG TPA: glycosyl transferase, partial [Bacteroidetes bacterium]|nr:glycosyl transferase [Bacteroidota bacterium]